MKINIGKKDDEPFDPDQGSATHSDSVSEYSTQTAALPRRSSRMLKPRKLMNLSTWVCLVSAIPNVLKEVTAQQNQMSSSQQHDICMSTCNDLINDMRPLSFATGLAENEAFHLGQMLKQEDRRQFADAIESDINGHGT